MWKWRWSFTQRLAKNFTHDHVTMQILILDSLVQGFAVGLIWAGGRRSGRSLGGVPPLAQFGG
jgi:hypothetical protein